MNLPPTDEARRHMLRSTIIKLMLDWSRDENMSIEAAAEQIIDLGGMFDEHCNKQLAKAQSTLTDVYALLPPMPVSVDGKTFEYSPPAGEPQPIEMLRRIRDRLMKHMAEL